MSQNKYSIQDTDEYMILLNAAESDESFPQLVYDLSGRYPSLKIFEIYQLATEKLEKLLQSQALEIVKIYYHRLDDSDRTEHLPLAESLRLLHRPEIWDRANENNDEIYRMWTTELGHILLDEYEHKGK